MDIDHGRDIDESLYSRQLYIIDHASMQRVMESNVLVLGLGGLGVEVAKNVILTGVKSVALYDPKPTSMLDLSSQFYLSESDIGKSRAEASLEKLVDLNPTNVEVTVYNSPITEEYLQRFQVVVCTDTTLEEQLMINDICRNNNIKFVAAETRGVFASVFCDFGKEFIVHDSTGEPLRSYMIAGITQGKPGVVSLVDDVRCDLESGDRVTFRDVQGMEVNDLPPQKINVTSPYTVEIEDTSSLSAYIKGGAMTEVKMPQIHNFLSLREAIQQPDYLITDFAKMDRPPQLHLGFSSLHQFVQVNSRLPMSHSYEDAEQVLSIAKTINENQKIVETIQEDLIKQLSYTAMGTISPMTSFIGGVVAQEILKACTGKFTPIKQWLYFDAVEALPEGDLPAQEFQPVNSRYDSQIVVFGRQVQQDVQNLRYFLVGAGAIGCEMLKTWACMGVASGLDGMVHVTDMDTIEKSNLSRQFLFRNPDVEQLKSETAARAAKRMNPSMNIKHYALRVGAETEDTFNNEFYASLNGVCNALDNVEARMYMDGQCVSYRRPLLESGTLGTKGNTQVIAPDLTESYASSRDPPEKTIPMCTLHHFPNRIEHTIQWARDQFEGLFKNAIENTKAYVQQPNFLEALRKQTIVTQLDILKSVHSSLVGDRPQSFDDCIKWARLRFEEFFNNNIKQLLFNFPPDMITSSGTPFWSGPKKAPHPVDFNENETLHMDFIVATACLRADNFGIALSADDLSAERVRAVLSTVHVPPFKPKSGLHIPADEGEAKNNQPVSHDVDEAQVEKLLAELPTPASLQGMPLVTAEFEKDNDANHHIDFITACSNLRAANYEIEAADRHKTKGIAGKIIPAMVTSTAVVAGLVCLEMMKLVQKVKLERYKNGFVNLALPLVTFSEPQPPEFVTVREGWKWSLWDRFDIDGPKTVQDLIDFFHDKYQLEVTMLSAGLTLLYAFFMKKDVVKERLNTEIGQLFEKVSGKPIAKGISHLQLTICCARDEDGEDVDVPWINYKLSLSDMSD